MYLTLFSLTITCVFLLTSNLKCCSCDEYRRIKYENESFTLHGTNPSTVHKTLQIEVAIFLDQKCRNILETKLNTTSDHAIERYVTTLIQMMSLIYQRPSMLQKVIFRLTWIEFLDNGSKIENHNGSVHPFLQSFCAYASNMNVNGRWDHSMLLTGLDLSDGVSQKPIGIAFRGGMCSRRRSCSVIEGTSLSAATVMAHEMGHSFGMLHDGEKINRVCNPETHVMAAQQDRDQSTWSICSNKNMNAFLKRLSTSNLRNRGYCLQDRNGQKSFQFDEKLPGERYPADIQCALHCPREPKAIMPEHAKTLVNGSEMNDMCAMLYCSDGTQSVKKAAHPALDGTECAPGKQCQGGKCTQLKAVLPTGSVA